VLFWRLLRHPQQGTAPRFTTKSRQWWGGVAGILTALSLAAASLPVRHSPSTDQPTGDITSYFTNHRASALLAAYLLGFGAAVLLFFVGALRELLGRDEELRGLAEVPPVLRRPDHLVPAGVAAFRLRW
jgi:hypothetical protein